MYGCVEKQSSVSSSSRLLDSALGADAIESSWAANASRSARIAGRDRPLANLKNAVAAISGSPTHKRPARSALTSAARHHTNSRSCTARDTNVPPMSSMVAVIGIGMPKWSYIAWPSSCPMTKRSSAGVKSSINRDVSPRMSGPVVPLLQNAP